MKKVAPHLGLATSIKISNVWLLEDSQNRRFLVDTGFYTDRPTLKASLWRAGVRRKGDLHALLLTHRHSDHAGNAAWIRREFDCPVICHPDDMPVLEGRCPPSPLKRTKALAYEKLLCIVEDTIPSVSPVDDVFEVGKWKWGFTVVHTPGHTEGSVMLYHEPTQTLFTGDAILAGIPPLRMIEYLSLAVPAFSMDAETCRSHVCRFLKELPPIDSLCSGHGPVVTTDVNEKLTRMAKRYGIS